MGQFAIPLMIASTIMSASSSAQAGQQAEKAGQAQQTAANYQADSAEQNAGQQRAASQRVAQARRQEATLAASRAQAVGAASGTVDPRIEADIAGQGEFNALSALYEGEEAARGLETDAALARFQGRQMAQAGGAKKAAYQTEALSSLAMGGYKAFGGGGGAAIPAASTINWTGPRVNTVLSGDSNSLSMKYR